MAKIIDHDSVRAFSDYNRDYIIDNPLLTKLLSNCLNEILAKKLPPIDGFNISSKGGHLVVLITQGICMVFGNYSSQSVLELISKRILSNCLFNKMCVAGSKKLVEGLMNFNSLSYVVDKYRIHYECTAVNPMTYAPGKKTLLDVSNIEAYVDFGLGLNESYKDGTKPTREIMKDSILTSIHFKRIFQWVDNNHICSMCRGHFVEGTPTIDFFYTPAEKRRLGYGTSLVHSITAEMLETEVDACFLTADGNNPTSNSIFQKVGYKKNSEYLKVIVD